MQPAAAAARTGTVPGPADPLLPEDPERRERARLLRAWESSPLSRANFCALKGLSETQFDALIERARDEARQDTRARR